MRGMRRSAVIHLRRLAGIVLLALVAGCSGEVSNGTSPAAPAGAGDVTQDPGPSSQLPPALARLRAISLERETERPAESYRIGPGDLLELNVFDLPELNRKVRVARSGYVQLPLIGAVQAEGRSEAELARDIAARLRRDYLHDPQVDVFVEEYKSQQVAVTGAVAEPGLYPLTRERYTILDMISEAGGLTKDSGGVIEFIPALDGKSSPVFAVASAGDALPAGLGAPDSLGGSDAVAIDLNELLRGGNQAALNVPVAAGDVIFVPEAGTFTIEGWIDKPGTYPLGRTTTVLAAISAGGGPLFPARLGRVEILRNTNGGESAREAIEVDLGAVREGTAADVPLRSGDIVRVPAWKTLVVPWGVYELVRSLVHIGASMPII